MRKFITILDNPEQIVCLVEKETKCFSAYAKECGYDVKNPYFLWDDLMLECIPDNEYTPALEIKCNEEDVSKFEITLNIKEESKSFDEEKCVKFLHAYKKAVEFVEFLAYLRDSGCIFDKLPTVFCGINE